MTAFITTLPVRLTSFAGTNSLRRPCVHRHYRQSFPARIPPKSATDSPAPKEPAPKEPPFELRGFSLANLFLAAGGLITITSFSSYINSSGTSSATSLGFVYGVPILLIGFALKYAELQPVNVETTPEASSARETKGTKVQKKIYKDITRHRYGDEAHLSAALASLGLVPRGEPCPVLEKGKEMVSENGEYCLELLFTSSMTPYREWETKIDKFERFFGPNVKAQVEKVDSAKRLVALRLTSCS